MTRSSLLAAIRSAERESHSAARTLGMLGKMVEMILATSGDSEESGCDPAHEAQIAALAAAPKPLLRQWAAVCSSDPLLAHLIKSRKSYAQSDRTRGKGARCLEVVVLISFPAAMELGFRGSRNQWEALLRLRG
ncbi:MAG: hypothetical protein ACO1QR_13255 [Chthoniobacteraceae bacterium]